MRLVWYFPGLIAYSPLVYKLASGEASFELWMLLLIPFFFILNFVLFLIILRLGWTGALVWREIKEEKSFYGLAYVLLFIVGPLLYFFYYGF